jgi:hypothetical protein
MALGKIINVAIRESGWLDFIRDETGKMIPNPRNIPLITEFLKRFGSKYGWQTRFQTFMKTGTQIDNPGTHQCLTWDVFMGRLLIYGRNLHAVDTEYHNESSSSDSGSSSSSSDYSTDDSKRKSRRRKRNKKRHNKRSHKRSRHRSKSIPSLDAVIPVPFIQNQQGLLMNNNPLYNQNLRVLSTKKIEKIQKFDYVSIAKARDFWEQEKQNENDMELFHQLIDNSFIEGVNTIIYSYFMRKDQPEDANQAINWSQSFSPRQLFKIVFETSN